VLFGGDGAAIRRKAVGHWTQRRVSKNTSDLQWKMPANCDARPYATERKAAGAKTMGNNEKAIREEQWKQSVMQARAYNGVTPDAGDGVAREVVAYAA